MDPKKMFVGAVVTAALAAFAPAVRAEDGAPDPAQTPSAVSPDSPDSPDFAKAFAAFVTGRDGDEKGAEQALEAFAKLVAAEPQNPLYLAYLGSSWTLKGRDAWAPWTKMRHTEQGLAMLDKSLAFLAPEHEQRSAHGVPVATEVRLVASSTFLALPGLFHKQEAGKSVLAAALSSPGFALSTADVRAELEFLSAQVARTENAPGREAEALRRVLAAAPGSKVALAAGKRLTELPK
jgi:hypothetical protein